MSVSSWQVRATLYQHILIKKCIENALHAFRVCLGPTVATEVVLCGCTPQSLCGEGKYTVHVPDSKRK